MSDVVNPDEVVPPPPPPPAQPPVAAARPAMVTVPAPMVPAASGTPQVGVQTSVHDTPHQGVNPNLGVHSPMNVMQTFHAGTPMTQQTTAAPTQLQPPLMGGMSHQGSCACPWTGGEPNSDWTGLKNPNSINVNPLKLRSNHVKAARDFEDRQSGL